MPSSAILASVALLASSVIAGPIQPPYQWSIQNYKGAADTPTSIVTFDISGPRYHYTSGTLEDVPAFGTTCTWDAQKGSGYQECTTLSDSRSVAARIENVPNAAGAIESHVYIYFAFTDSTPEYIYEGDAIVGTNDPTVAQAFTVTPNSIRAVA